MKAIVGAVALMIGASMPVLAQTPVPPSQLTARPAQGLPGVSPAGMQILAKYQQQRDPALLQLVGQMKNASAQISAAIAGPTLNIDKVTVLFKQIEGYQAQLRARSDAHLLEMVRALPASDRTPFLRAVVNAKAPPQQR